MSRLLSWEDREALSQTYGCFDRNFWGWKFVDFAGARFQEGVYALAHCYSRPFAGNELAGNGRVLEWIRAGMRFWRKIQYPDGSFDEAYPLERSLAAVAFTGFYIGEGYLLVRDALPADERDGMVAAFRKAGDWLCRNDERHGVLSNHLAAAAAALDVIANITGDARYAARCRHFVNRILARQSAEGWYEEYGGADPGYQTHGTFYLARIWQRNRDPALLESLARSVRFLQYFIHPNGTLGGEYGSRNTEFYYPAGFEILAPAIPEAARIARFMRGAVAGQTVAGVSAMDAYNLLPVLNNYLFAGENAGALTEVSGPLPCEEDSVDVDFADAGVCVRGTRAYYAILGASKGGVLKVFSRDPAGSAVSDCGYWGRLASGRVVSSQALMRPARMRSENGEVVVEGDFACVNQRVPAPVLFLGFRVFMLTVGRAQAAAYWIKNLIVHVLVRRRKAAPLRLERRVTFGADSVRVCDRIERTGAAPVSTLRRGDKFSTIHMGSARYFQRQELLLGGSDPEDLAARLMAAGRVETTRTIAAVPAGGKGPA